MKRGMSMQTITVSHSDEDLDLKCTITQRLSHVLDTISGPCKMVITTFNGDILHKETFWHKTPVDEDFAEELLHIYNDQPLLSR